MSRRVVRFSLALGAMLAGWSAPASAEPALSLHFGPTSYPACEAIETDTLSCAKLIVEGDASSTQRAYVLMSGVPTLQAVEFGIAYPPTVDVLYWQACDDPIAVPQSGWPDSGTGITMAWGDGLEAGGADDLAIVGYLEIGAASAGVISLTVDPRRGTATYVDPEQFTYEIATSRLGQADVAGQGGGATSCGSTGWAGGGFGGPQGPSGVTACEPGQQSLTAIRTYEAGCPPGDGEGDFVRSLELVDSSDNWPDVASHEALAQSASFDRTTLELPGNPANDVIYMGVAEVTGLSSPYWFFSRSTRNPSPPADTLREKLHTDTGVNRDYPSRGGPHSLDSSAARLRWTS